VWFNGHPFNFEKPADRLVVIVRQTFDLNHGTFFKVLIHQDGRITVEQAKINDPVAQPILAKLQV
jgi:hypothetical protein